MRVTAVSGSPVDVEVDEGVPVGELRRRLVRLTGSPVWAAGQVSADGLLLDDAHPAGRPPLRHGAILRPGSGDPPAAVVAAHAERHLAVVAGPDSGTLLVPAGPATVGPGGTLPVADPVPWLVAVRPARARRRRGGGLRVRAVRGPVHLGRRDARRPRRVPRWRSVRWDVGAELRAGVSVLVLRSRTARRPAHRRLRALLRYVPALAGVGTSVALAAALHQPILALGALSSLLLVGPRATGAPPTEQAPDDEPADVAALRVALSADTAPLPARATGAIPWGPGDDVAVTGPRDAALAAARGLLLAALGADHAPAVALRTDRPEDWAWLAWARRVAGRLPLPDDEPTLVVLDGVTGDGGWSPGARHRALRVTAAAPSWCPVQLDVDGRSARVRQLGGPWRPAALVGVRAPVAEAIARSGGRAPVPPGGDGLALERCPADVALGALAGVPAAEPAAVAAAWERTRPGSLTTPLGAGPDGAPVVVDLVRDGPHALVAGTTGSGKSELLTTLVVGLALAQPPDRLAVLLVDFKGGTGLPALAPLPHVVGHLSDLDATGARRALRGLFAELRRRERVLGARGASDVRDLDPADPATPPRLLVVADEFRVLADELPDLLPGLARIAAQGRSLGVHLVLATQRPAGAVPADLRANVGLTAVLRVADAADSLDLVGVTDAARIARPGLAILARAGGRPEPLQVARAAPRHAAPVRLASPWLAATAWRPPQDEPEGPETWVRAIRAAAAGRPPAAQPWLPPLPARVRAADVPAGPGLALALADLPDLLARGPVRWDPQAGHLLVVGGPGSGRSTTLAAVASAALAAGRVVHAVGLAPGLLPDHPLVGSVLAADDVTRVARLVRLLATAPTGDRPRPLLVLDDVAAVLAELAGLARGAPAELLEQLWTSAGGPVAVVAAGRSGPATVRLAACFADRLVLGSPDPTADLLAGVPPELAGPRPHPGRAVHLGRGAAALCQAALPEPPDGGPGPDGPDAVRRVRPLPARALRPAGFADEAGGIGLGLGLGGDGGIGLGLGGDGAEPVRVDLGRPLLVVGPPGSGRSTALDGLAAAVARTGRAICSDGVPDDPEVLLVVDDLDEVEARDPALAEAIAARLVAGPPLRLVAATTTAHAVSAFRGPVPALVRARRLLVLDPAEPGGAELLGPEGAWLLDPRRRPPGRGALRLGRDVVPVQVWAPG